MTLMNFGFTAGKCPAANLMRTGSFRICVAAATLFFANISWSADSSAESESLVVASWNVENLFDTIDDPDNEGDDGYTPSGWARWNEKKYNLKIEHLAEVIAGIKPDILGLTEVENRRVLEDLVKVLKDKHGLSLPEIIHRDGADFRGIDVAVISRFKPVDTSWFSPVPAQRDTLCCDFIISGKPLTFMVNHWKSKLGKKADSDHTRAQQALAVRGKIDEILKDNPAAAIVVAGDFNSSIGAPFLVRDAGFLTELEELKDKDNQFCLYNLAAALPELERATYYYAPHEQWSSLDSISVTRGMLGFDPGSAWRVKEGSYKVYKPEKICFPGINSPLPYRRVRSKKYGDRFVEGYSDHFAVYTVLCLVR